MAPFGAGIGLDNVQAFVEDMSDNRISRLDGLRLARDENRDLHLRPGIHVIVLLRTFRAYRQSFWWM
eukprot:953291-Amphidinium_carterae.1